ncbi:hypothetical protein [Rhodoferax sp. WC2427]|uniref:hypothetical protein n=1 Tax=Rhodoferax sp. WC2427 TaxID=3234144 RepID=UPI0034650390
MRAHLVIADSDAKHNNFRRHLRFATLYERVGGSSWRTVAVMADPVILRTVGNGMLLAGVEVELQEARTHEYAQLWLCRPTHPGSPPLSPLDYQRELEKLLPTS